MKKYDKKEEEGKPATESSPLPCIACKQLTPWATLSLLGARCSSCYQAYCRDAFKAG